VWFGPADSRPDKNAGNRGDSSEYCVTWPLAVNHRCDVPFNRIFGQPLLAQLVTHGVSALGTTSVADKDTYGFLERFPRQEWLSAEIVDFDPFVGDLSSEMSTLKERNLDDMTRHCKSVLDRSDALDYVHGINLSMLLET
jgi:hypothetical protein